MRPSSVKAFFLRTLLFLPFCFALWYGAADVLIRPVGLAAGKILHWSFPEKLSGEVSFRRVLLFSTARPARPGGEEGGGSGTIGSYDPLMYTASLPLFVALMLASGGRRLGLRIALGVVALFPFQLWGVAFDVAYKILASVHPASAWDAWAKVSSLLGFRLGFMIFPTVVPVVLWFVLNREMLAGLLEDVRNKRGTAA